jgi:superfamily I DNA/RNA helicase
VLSAAVSLIEANSMPGRIEKTPFSLYATASPIVQGSVFRWRFGHGTTEAKSIAKSCAALIATGMRPQDILILLCNTRVLEVPITKALEDAGVHFDRWGAKRLVDSDDGRLALTVLRLVCDEDDYVAHRTLLGLKPQVGVGTTNGIAEAALKANLNYKELFFKKLPEDAFTARQTRAISAVVDVVSELSGWSGDDLIGDRRDDLAGVCERYRGDVSRDLWLEVSQDLPDEMTLQEARVFIASDNEEMKADLLRQVHGRAGREVVDPPLPDRVRVMTMHGAKGLGARVVFIPGLEDELFPGPKRTPYPGLVLEAARLLYVSMTRAQIVCVLSYSIRRFAYGSLTKYSPSRFLANVGGTFSYRTAEMTNDEVDVVRNDNANL